MGLRLWLIVSALLCAFLSFAFFSGFLAERRWFSWVWLALSGVFAYATGQAAWTAYKYK
jgi:hypothetical protein